MLHRAVVELDKNNWHNCTIVTKQLDRLATGVVQHGKLALDLAANLFNIGAELDVGRIKAHSVKPELVQSLRNEGITAPNFMLLTECKAKIAWYI